MARTWLAHSRASFFGCLGACLSLSLGACSNQDPGELLLVVTTDMAVPTDLNWLDLTVARAGSPDEHRSIELKSAASLPGTLAIVAGNREAALVTITLEARTGGKDGDVRVRREARLSLPATGQKMLPMPLNWLCSDANQPAEGCGAGKTCDAGRCVDSSITQQLGDYTPLAPAPCFDARDCPLTDDIWDRVTPNIDTIQVEGEGMQLACFIEAKSVPTRPMNVALIIEPGLAGTAGLCAPVTGADPSTNHGAGDCFVPLNQDDTSNGWQYVSIGSGQHVVRLPSGVCDAARRCSVKRVALTFNSSCTPKTVSAPLCELAPRCVTSPMSCPSTFSDSWTGYSCSGSSPPSGYSDSGPGHHYCGIPTRETLSQQATMCSEILPQNRGDFCCTLGQRPQADPLLIDDMSDGPLIKLPVPPGLGLFPGSWFTATDDTLVLPSPLNARDKLFTYTSFTPPVTPPDGEPSFDRAACFQMPNGLKGNFALEGFSFFAHEDSTVQPVDVSQYGGMTFWAKAVVLEPGRELPEEIGVFFPNFDTDTEHQSSCILLGQGKGQCSAHRKLLSLSEKWQKFSVRWNELAQGNFGMPYNPFNPLVYSVDFEALGPAPNALGHKPGFEFCVSQIRFLELTAP